MVLRRKKSKRREENRWSAIKEFLFGLLAFDTHRGYLSMWSKHRDVFMLLTLGDVFGIPVLPPYYSLRILPYFIHDIKQWKRRLLRERHVFALIN
ncbi:MAG: hypothetical protein ACE5GD_08035 [Candidatus Geothermarchaeales archaeon]